MVLTTKLTPPKWHLRSPRSMAFKEAMRKADPVILEPIMEVTVNTPEEYMGDVIGDLNSRRGQIQRYGGRIRRPGDPRVWFLCLRCSVTPPICEARLRAVATYATEPHSYVEVPKNIAEKIISERTKNN